jgi:ABC-type polysaccharide/polyol phosphate export permease
MKRGTHRAENTASHPRTRAHRRTLNWAGFDLTALMVIAAAVALFVDTAERAEWLFLIVALTVLALNAWALFSPPAEDSDSPTRNQ